LGLQGDYWIVRDVAETKGEHEYSLAFHYARSCRPIIEPNGRSAGDDGHRIFTFGDNGTLAIEDGWVSGNHGARSKAPVLRFRSKAVGTQEFFTFILPVQQWTEPPTVEEIFVNGGRGFEIRIGGFTDLFIFNDSPGQIVDAGVFSSDFKYTWARAAEGQSTPEEFVIANGNQLILNGSEIIRPHDAHHASIRRLGDDLYIKTDLGIAKRSLIS
jgi:hypothetical protein